MSFLNTKKPGAFYTGGEEIANAITHGVGAALAIAGTVILVVSAVGDVWKVVSSAIYGASMLVLFLMSCLYHALTNRTAKKVMRVFDHTSIFLLIAGTYTPFTLVTLRGWVGWTIFGIVWGCAVFGIVLNIISGTGAVTGYYTSADKLITTAKSGMSPISDSMYPYMVKNRDFRLIRKSLMLLKPLKQLKPLKPPKLQKPLWSLE